MSFPNETSFYYLLTTGLESQGNYSIHTPMSAFWSAKDLTMNRYDGLERNTMSSTALDEGAGIKKRRMHHPRIL